jgi:hypothetical protein
MYYELMILSNYFLFLKNANAMKGRITLTDIHRRIAVGLLGSSELSKANTGITVSTEK